MIHSFDTASLVTTPWKNGGGSTCEIVRRPAGADLDHFDWRVSIATIGLDGPFSTFPGVDRIIMLLDGQGIRLRMAGGADHTLDQALAPFPFRGEEAVDCALLGGTSTDFNVMVRRDALQAQLTVLHTATELPVTRRGLLLSVRGTWISGDQALAPGSGVWWDETPLGGEVRPLSGDQPALVWLQMTETTR